MSLDPFVVWAPSPSSVALMIKKPGDREPTRISMARNDEGWWHPAEPFAR